MRQASQIAKAAVVTDSIQNLERDVYSIIQADDEDAASRQQAAGALLVNASALLEQAEKADNPDLAAMARIKAAQALRTELHIRAERVESDELHTRIDQARDAYEKALASAKTPTLRGMAKLGLGLCAEELGQRDAAAAIYKEILDTPEFAATVVPAQAQRRLDNLDENLESFAFAPVPPEATPPAKTEIDPATLMESAPPPLTEGILAPETPAVSQESVEADPLKESEESMP